MPGRFLPARFTLIELLVVIAVISILMAILVPALHRCGSANETVPEQSAAGESGLDRLCQRGQPDPLPAGTDRAQSASRPVGKARCLPGRGLAGGLLLPSSTLPGTERQRPQRRHAGRQHGLGDRHRRTAGSNITLYWASARTSPARRAAPGEHLSSCRDSSRSVALDALGLAGQDRNKVQTNRAGPALARPGDLGPVRLLPQAAPFARPPGAPPGGVNVAISTATSAASKRPKTAIAEAWQDP
jgi:prepilin-type N-terminal cleavage/methylation domain-containing protein